MRGKHTPGPWTWAPNDRDVVILGDGGELVAAMRPTTEPRDIEQRLVDARLIAAAPELLAACRALVDCQGHSSLHDMVTKPMTEPEALALEQTWFQATKAIAKAKGGVA